MNLPTWLVIALLGISVFFAQSSSTGPVDATPDANDSAIPSRREIVAEAQQNPESELEERVLADGVITHEEYQEAVNTYIGCMAEAGYEVTTTPAMFTPGMYQYEIVREDDPATPASDAYFEKLMAADMDCSIGTTYTIEAIYGNQIVNPDDLPLMELTLACLESKDLVEAGSLTSAELQAELAKENPDLPFDIWDIQASSCLVNPSQNGIQGNPLRVVMPDGDVVIATPTP
ncbi:MAG: hypothetical protein KC435_09195 [Thermomicrobiales bacterium]|nr:hypothetical protein [Thermomicrobiales bacterium]